MKVIKCPECIGTGWIDKRSSVDSMFIESKTCYKCRGEKVIEEITDKGMERDRKTEIVAEQLIEAIEKLREQYGQEIQLKFEANYETGYIGIRVMA